MSRRYVFSEFREQRIAEASIEVDMGDGLVVVVPPAECWPDKMPHGAKAYESILGSEQFAAFTEAGGTLRLLDAIIEDAQGVGKGK